MTIGLKTMLLDVHKSENHFYVRLLCSCSYNLAHKDFRAVIKFRAGSYVSQLILDMF